MKKSLNPNHKFVCVKCVYSTNSRKDYNKHCTTKKHKKSHNKEKIIENVENERYFKCDTEFTGPYLLFEQFLDNHLDTKAYL